MLGLALVLFSIHGLQATSETTPHWGVSPSDCRTRVDMFDVSCRWTPPPSVPAEDCQLFFRITPGHPHGSELFCDNLSSWTECLHPRGGSLCSFSDGIEHEDGVFAICGDLVDVRVHCNGTISEIVTIDGSNSTEPDPVADLQARAVGTTEMNVTWDLPPSWIGYDLLVFVIDSWDEFSLHHNKSVVYQDDEEVRHCVSRTCSYILGVDYAHTNTCVRVAVYYKYNPLLLMSWSETVCSNTHGAAPFSPPTGIEVTTVRLDWDNNVRVVNVSWLGIPEHHRGGQDLWYIVSARDGAGRIATQCNVTQHSCVLEVAPSSSYTFEVIAMNDAGKSDLEVSDRLYALEQRAPKYPYYIGTLIACLVILLVTISGVFILRKKMRASHLPSITFPEKMVTVNLIGSKKEAEVFDTLKTREPLRCLDNGPGAVCYPQTGVDGPRVTPKRSRQAPLMTLEFSEELMPLAIDAYPYDDGQVSPTDSGHCGDQSDTGYDVSPIPVSFLPNFTAGSRFGGNNEREALIGSPAGYVGNGDRSDVGAGDTELSPLRQGNSVEGPTAPPLQAAAGRRLTTGAVNTAGGNYTPQSEGSSLGYVQQSLASDTANSDTGGPSYFTERQPPSSNSATPGSTISSYVQHGEASPPPYGSNVGWLPTSGGSDCPPYVKQTSNVEERGA